MNTTLTAKIARFEEYVRADRELCATSPEHAKKYASRLRNHEAKLARYKEQLAGASAPVSLRDMINRKEAVALISAIEEAWQAEGADLISDVYWNAYDDEEELSTLDNASCLTVTINAARPAHTKAAEDAQQEAAARYLKIAAEVLHAPESCLPWTCTGNGADGDLYEMNFSICRA